MGSFLRDLDRTLDDLGPAACFIVVIAFIAYIAFLSALDRVLKRVDPENRRMEPGQVWLSVLPVFNLVWLIVTIERVGESLRNEFISRGRFQKAESYGKAAGLGMMFLAIVGIPFAAIGTPCTLIFWVIAFVYGIVYWLQLFSYARQLKGDRALFAPPMDEGW